jgi:hypothetical protein
MDTEEEPFLQDFDQLFAAVFEGGSVGVYSITDRDFTIERPIVCKDFIGGMT